MAEHILSITIDVFRDKGLTFEKRVEYGIPQDRIVDVAEKGNCGLIATPTKGLEVTTRFTLGSACEHVVHRAKYSVLLLPATK